MTACAPDNWPLLAGVLGLVVFSLGMSLGAIFAKWNS
jgi:hypothetical protein